MLLVMEYLALLFGFAIVGFMFTIRILKMIYDEIYINWMAKAGDKLLKEKEEEESKRYKVLIKK